jgi:3-hydroxy-9,10-secoandrosta-1,3,5(10)-triene-9,17-dione monooxygenase
VERWRSRARARWPRSAAAIDTLFRTAGGLAVFDDSELQRAYRDVNAAAAHIGNNWDAAGTQYGAIALGLPAPEGWV